jgi:hypothetical protein
MTSDASNVIYLATGDGWASYVIDGATAQRCEASHWTSRVPPRHSTSSSLLLLTPFCMYLQVRRCIIIIIHLISHHVHGCGG